MTHEEKLVFLKKHYLGRFLTTRQLVFHELADRQTMLCCCGKLATGLHEMYCKKFNGKVDKETIKRLGSLLPK